jgi:hypothetical protein
LVEKDRLIGLIGSFSLLGLLGSLSSLSSLYSLIGGADMVLSVAAFFVLSGARKKGTEKGDRYFIL